MSAFKIKDVKTNQNHRNREPLSTGEEELLKMLDQDLEEFFDQTLFEDSRVIDTDLNGLTELVEQLENSNPERLTKTK